MPYSANTIAPSSGGYEPQRVNNWEIELSAPGLNGEVLNLSLLSFDPPADTIEPISIPYANEDRKVAGRVTRDNVTLVVREYVKESVLETLKTWQLKVFNPESGGIGYAKDYKAEGHVFMLDPMLQRVPGKVFSVFGVWPSKITVGTLDQSGNDQVQVTVDLVVDKMVYGEG